MNFVMVSQFCSERVKEVTQLIQTCDSFILTITVLHLVFSVVTTLGNLLVIRVLWKMSSIPVNLKKLFLNLAFSDLAVGLFAQLMYGVIVAVMIKTTWNGSYDFDFLCPIISTVCYFSLFLLACVSFLTITAIAVDRLLAVSLHLRYQELVTTNRVIVTLASLWLTSGVAASIFISLSSRSRMVIVVIQIAGLLLTTAAYIRIYKVARYHWNQIHSQQELQNAQVRKLLREKKSAINALFVYIVFLLCYVPYFCSVMLLIINNFGISFLVAEHCSVFLILFNSSLNPLVYCWRYRELRVIAKSMVKKVLCITGNGT